MDEPKHDDVKNDKIATTPVFFFCLINKEVEKKLRKVKGSEEFFGSLDEDSARDLQNRTNFFKKASANPSLYNHYYFNYYGDKSSQIKFIEETFDTSSIEVYGNIVNGGVILITGNSRMIKVSNE